MAGAGYKTFTAGEVLTASDVNTYLMQQSVQNYGGTAARSSAIPTPSTGMVSYIGDDGNGVSQIQAYNGSSWNTMGGLVLVKTQTIGTGVSSVTVTGAFSSTYDNYVIAINGGTASTTGGITMQLGSTNTGYYEARPGVAISGGTYVGNVTNNGTAFNIGSYSTTGKQCFDTLLNPFNSTETVHFSGSYSNGTTQMNSSNGYLNNQVSYTAFTVAATSGTWTGGTIAVYGYRKA